MSFKLAQTFYIDKTTVRNAESVTLTSVDLYFKSKPREQSNRSGIYKPGVSIVLLETRDDDTPNIDRPIETSMATNGYDSIVATSDASIATKFYLSEPTVIKTNKSYAVAVLIDGDEDYELWKAKEGENIVGTNTILSGATAAFVGRYYEYLSPLSGDSTTQEKWKPLNNIDLKFTVYCAQYDANTLNDDINMSYIMPADPHEYILFDRYHANTTNWQNILNHDYVFQETPVIYGPINVDANSFVITCPNTINFSTLISPSTYFDNRIADDDPVILQKSYIVLRNGTNQSANVNVREVVELISNTEIRVESLPSFTNNAASFSVTAVGTVSDLSTHWYTGRWWNATTETMETIPGKRIDILKLSETNANSSVRFVNNMVQSITIANGGSGYSNSDVVTVYPVTNANTANANHINYIESYSNATANIVTNGSGTITGIAITNPGYGLISEVSVNVATSGGSSANLVPKVGSMLRSESSNATFSNTVVTNIPSNRVFPNVNVLANQHHDYRIFHHFPYYVTAGKEHILKQASPAAKKEINTLYNVDLSDFASTDSRQYVIASRSNEVAMSSNVSIKVANGSTLNLDVKSSSILELSFNTNNAFTVPLVKSDSVYNFNYIINNDSTNEHKNNGNALAKHISEKVTFLENRAADDIMVYVQAWVPTGTSIKAYARIYDKTDSDAFDDKDWTELQLRSNNATQTSSLNNKNDLIEFAYSLPDSPPSVNTIAGSVNLTNGSANVSGVGTDFVSDLESGDIIKIYPKMFPQNYMVTTVDTISNTTFMTIKDVVDDTDLLGSSVNIDFVGRVGSPEIGRPFSAWCNKSSSYVSRYYDSNLGKHDTYTTFAIKIVLLSDNVNIAPELENIRAVGVSA